MTSAATCFASATLRASGFSQAIPASVALPRSTALTISSTFSMRAWFGPVSQMASIVGVGHHLGDGRVRLGGPDVQPAREGGRLLGVLAVRAPDAEHVGVAHRLTRLHVEAGVEPAADEADPETLASATSVARSRRASRALRADSRCHSTKMLPMYWRSFDADRARKKPEAVRSRNSLKNATPWRTPAGAFSGQAMSSSRAVRCVARRTRNGARNGGALRCRATPARRASTAVRPGSSIRMKSMNSGTPASVALPERSSLGNDEVHEHPDRRHSWAVKNFGA